MNAHDPCARWRPLVPWYVNSTLSPAELAEVEDHLVDCAACQHAVAQWRAIARVADASVPAVPVARSLDDALARLHRRMEPPQAIVTLPEEKDSAYMSPTPAPTGNAQAPRLHRRTPLIAAMSVTLIAVLALAGFAWFNPHARSGIATHPTSPTPTATLQPPTPTPQPCKALACATDQNITVRLDAAYVDASQTDIVFDLSSSAYDKNTVSGMYLGYAQIQDSQGNNYAPQEGGSLAGHSSYQSFEPLIPQLLTRPQALTLMIFSINVNNHPTNGTWNLPFNVTPVVAHTILFHIAPITHGGVTIQPISLEIVHGQHPFIYNGGKGQGARLIIRISDPGDPRALPYFIYFDQTVGLGGGHLTIDGTIPATTQILPGTVTSVSEEVGLAYWLPLMLNGPTAQLAITRVQVDVGTFVNGPWNFDLPLH